MASRLLIYFLFYFAAIPLGLLFNRPYYFLNQAGGPDSLRTTYHDFSGSGLFQVGPDIKVVYDSRHCPSTYWEHYLDAGVAWRAGEGQQGYSECVSASFREKLWNDFLNAAACFPDYCYLGEPMRWYYRYRYGDVDCVVCAWELPVPAGATPVGE